MSLNNTNWKRPELLIQTGHSSSIRSVAFGPDNRVLATGSTNGVIMLWDVNNGYVLRRFSGHYDNTLCMAFSAQGDTLLSASSRKYSGKSLNRTYDVKSSIRVQIWDVHSGKQIHQLEIQSRDVSCPKFFPDGNEPSGELKFSPNGEFLAFAGQECQLFDVKTGEMIYMFEEEDFSSAIAFSRDGSRLASILTGDAKCKISLWDVYTGDKLNTFSEQDTNIHLLAFPSNSKQLLSVPVAYSVSVRRCTTL